MKTIIDFIHEAKQDFLIKGHTINQKRNTLNDFIDFYCLNYPNKKLFEDYPNIYKNFIDIPQLKLKKIFNKCSISYLYHRLSSYPWKNFSDFYKWLHNHRTDKINVIKVEEIAANNLYVNTIRVNDNTELGTEISLLSTKTFNY